MHLFYLYPLLPLVWYQGGPQLIKYQWGRVRVYIALLSPQTVKNNNSSSNF